MGENSKIEWTDMTFNPWIGCQKVSDGCRWCYAETLMDHRYGRVKWGPQGTRQRTSDANWRKPLQWNRQAEREGRRFRVFCASLADVFEDRPELVPWRVQLWHLIGRTPHLDWLLLTKRPENASIMTPTWWVPDWPANVWIGTSVEDQASADARIPHLLRVPARVRFLSCEPLLGPVRLDNGESSWLTCDGTTHNDECCESYAVRGEHFHGISWIIVGGESGRNARPMHPDWARSLRDQCQAAGTPYFFKQHGEWISKLDVADLTPDGWVIRPEWRPVVNPADWGCLSHDGIFRPLTTTWNGRQNDPGDDYEVSIFRVGKKAAGRLLDGREWNEFPSTEAVR